MSLCNVYVVISCRSALYMDRLDPEDWSIILLVVGGNMIGQLSQKELWLRFYIGKEMQGQLCRHRNF